MPSVASAAVASSEERRREAAEKQIIAPTPKLGTASEPLKTEIGDRASDDLIKTLDTNIARSILGKRQRLEET